jgi:large subunit ribosomal protein L21
MYAIVATSGKQFRVTEGDRILVDRVSANVGQTVRLDSVLLVGGDQKPLVGMPFIEGAAVEATVVSHRSGDKVIVFKFEARKRKRRKIGHRQQLSELRIGAIHAPGDGGNPPPRPSPRGKSRGPDVFGSPTRGEGEQSELASAKAAGRPRRTRKASSTETTTEE